MHSLLVVAAEILGAIFLPKKVLYDKSGLITLLTKSKIVWHWQKEAGAVPRRSLTYELRCTCVMQQGCLSCVLTNGTWHSHQFGVKKACCHFVFTCNNSLCWCKPSVFGDKQTCPGFQGWMGTSRLTAGLSPEYIPVYLDITDDIGVFKKKGNTQPAIRKSMWQEHILQQRYFTAEKSWAPFPGAGLLAEAWRLQGCCSMSQWAAHAAENSALGWLILLIGIGRHNGAMITVTLKWCILTGLKKHPHQDEPPVTFLIFKDIWEDTTKCIPVFPSWLVNKLIRNIKCRLFDC